MGMQAATVQWLQEWFERNRESLLNDFQTFLSFPSISTQREHVDDMDACLRWLQDYVEQIGFRCERWETSRHPVLFAERTAKNPNAPTVLIYNHYDVQPVDPLELWQSPPFEADIREGEIYARGAQDNKGQCFYVLSALRALIERDGDVPLTVKLCIEGEEEAGSHGLKSILDQRAEKMRCDHFLVVDMGVHSLDRPAITLGIRGMSFATLVAESSYSDLHSGLYGGVARNPLHVLVEALAAARAPDGSIAIPGFYEEVMELSAEDRAVLDLEFDEQQYIQQTGYAPLGGEHAHSPLESAWLRPTLEINGLSGGYSGEGIKTVIPAQATAKISCRLVPQQDPARIARLVKEFFEGFSSESCSLRVQAEDEGGRAVRSNINNPGVLAASTAIAEVFDTPCRYIQSGGSIPIIASMSEVVGCEPVLLGFGLPGDNMHAPNEHFGIGRLRQGTAVIGRTLELLAK